MKTSWVVVQYAGFTSEKVVHEARTFDDAFCAMCEMYEPGERDELHVDVMKRLPDGSLTTEF